MLLKLDNVSKFYPGVTALDKVSLEIKKGEVHALVGENGAGKSTLIKIITGAIEANGGTIEFEGKKFEKLSPSLSKQLGIEAIYQEFNLVPSLTVAENMFLGMKLNNSFLINKKRLYERAAEVLRNFNVNIKPQMEVNELSVAYMQIVEIAKAMVKNAKLIIMDEPTAALTEDEVDSLIEIIHKLKNNGVSIIYISHRLEEIFRVADRVTVMRDGKIIETKDAKQTTKDALIFSMVGRTLSETFPQKNCLPGDIVLKINGISGNGIEPISLEVRKGEILGLAGLMGSGRTELARLIFGADSKKSGEIFINGQKIIIKNPQDAVKHGIGFVSEDRKEEGVILELSIKDNICITVLKKLSRLGIVKKISEILTAKNYIDAINIKTPSENQLVKNLSGGNQQKVALGKWLARKSNVLIFDEPTRGIDVGAKQEIYQLINHLCEQGIAVIMISSEMEELLGMSDRLIVLSEGKVAGTIPKEKFSPECVLRYASANM
jgi:ribose transport system ATP-binding protein